MKKIIFLCGLLAPALAGAATTYTLAQVSQGAPGSIGDINNKGEMVGSNRSYEDEIPFSFFK